MKKFEEQVKEAKRKRLESRIVRDIIFIILGLFFLILSIFSAQKEKNKETQKSKTTTTITTTIKKTK